MIIILQCCPDHCLEFELFQMVASSSLDSGYKAGVVSFRPPSPPLDVVQEKYVNTSKLADDFSIALRGCELADVMFIVGEDRTPLYGVKAILACRSRYACSILAMLTKL